MNENSRSRIVVGVALAAVFAAGVYEFGVRTAHQQQLASATPPTAIAAPPAAPPAEPVAAPEPQPTSEAGAIAAAPSVPSPEPATTSAAPSIAQNGVGSAAHRAALVKHDTARLEYKEDKTEAGNDDHENPAPASAHGDDAAADSDSQISADVKSQIATAAPNSDVKVTTTDGVVALAGSVPDQDAVDQAKQAALRVEGVKTVDASGLLVNNQ